MHILQTAPPTPPGVLGESWWYYTTFTCVLWGHPPPVTDHQLRHLLSVTRFVLDFVLRDRMGLLIDVDAERTAAAGQVSGSGGGDGLWVQVAMPLEGALQQSSSLDRGPGDDDSSGVGVGTALQVSVWTAMEGSLGEVADVIHAISEQPEILVG